NRNLQRSPHGHEPGAGWPQGAGDRDQEPRLRRQDLSRLLCRSGETAMLKSIFVLSPLTFLIGLPAAQAAQPEAHTPYHLQVVLHVAKHRLLTDVFRDRVERELRDGLQASLGELARVEVVRDHP